MMKSQPFPASSLQNYAKDYPQDAKKSHSSAYSENHWYQRFGQSSFDGIGAADISGPQVKARQTTPCKHFMRTGLCPVGDACHFIHDLSLKTVDKGEGAQVDRHCWAHVQGGCCVRSCQYFHPYDIRPYKKYTPCYDWDLCPNPRTCPFKHPGQGSSHPEVIAPVQLPRVPPMLMMDWMSYSSTDTMVGCGPLYRSTTEERAPDSEPRAPSSARNYRGIYAGPSSSYADHHIRAGSTDSIAPLDALPGPSFEDSPPQMMSSHMRQKIYANNAEMTVLPPGIHGSYTCENGVPFYPGPPYQGFDPVHPFDRPFKEIRISSVGRLGQRRPSGSDSQRGYSSWIAQLQEEAQRKTAVGKQTFS